MKIDKIKFKFVLLTNFKPNNNININFKIKKKNKISCKNFFFFFYLLKYFNKNFFFLKSRFFIKPCSRKLLTILRPPYKNKLSRHQLINTRYFINFNFEIFSQHFCKNEITVIFLKKLINFFKNFSFWFETNLIYLHSFNFFFKFFNKNFFLIK